MCIIHSFQRYLIIPDPHRKDVHVSPDSPTLSSTGCPFESTRILVEVEVVGRMATMAAALKLCCVDSRLHVAVAESLLLNLGGERVGPGE